AFLRENEATFPNVLDASEAATRVSIRKFKCSGVPLNYIIDREGKVVDAWYGYQEGHPRAKKNLRKLRIGTEGD
ncbi:MAG: peroxiredoxin family protein, partial [Planctomycetota bacterium]